MDSAGHLIIDYSGRKVVVYSPQDFKTIQVNSNAILLNMISNDGAVWLH